MTGSKWRTDGNRIRVQVGDEPSDDDDLIGIMFTPDQARQAVDGVNAVKLVPVDESEDE